MSSRNMSLLPWATLHSDSEQIETETLIDKLIARTIRSDIGTNMHTAINFRSDNASQEC